MKILKSVGITLLVLMALLLGWVVIYTMNNTYANEHEYIIDVSKYQAMIEQNIIEQKTNPFASTNNLPKMVKACEAIGIKLVATGEDIYKDFLGVNELVIGCKKIREVLDKHN